MKPRRTGIGFSTFSLSQGAFLLSLVLASSVVEAQYETRYVRIEGTVTDVEGNAVSARIRFLPRHLKEGHIWLTSCTSVAWIGEGRFVLSTDKKVSNELVESNSLLIKFTHEGYKARVLQYGRDFKLDGEPLDVVLEPGPYGPNESIFASATGYPATDDGVASLPHAASVRESEVEYRYLAAVGRVPDDKLPRKPTQPGLSVGNPPLAEPFETPWFVLASQKPAGASGLPRIRVTDQKGKAVTRIKCQWAFPVDRDKPLAADNARLWGDGAPVRVFEDEQGVYTVPKGCMVWVEGYTPAFVPAEAGNSADPLRVELLPSAKESRNGATRVGRDGEELHRPTRSELKDMLRALPEQAVVKGRRPPEFYDTLEVVRTFEIKQAAPVLRDLLKRSGRRIPIDRVVETIVAIEGDGATRFFAGLASDESKSYRVRREAVIALGQIGSKRSVKAFKRLRDKARKLPEAPQEQESYTHAERMAEAIILTTEFMVGKNPDLPISASASKTARVSEDYLSGEMHCGNFHYSTNVELRRFGDEWLVVRIGGTICV